MDVTEYVWVELGEGFEGDYNPSDPDDVGLLRLDYLVNGEEVESLCTKMPVSTPDVQRQKALDMVQEFATQHPELRPRTIVELFSWMEPEWLNSGIPSSVLTLFSLPRPTPVKIQAFRVDGEIGEAVDEVELGPFEYVQITYQSVRTNTDDPLFVWSEEKGWWYRPKRTPIEGSLWHAVEADTDTTGYSDITIVGVVS